MINPENIATLTKDDIMDISRLCYRDSKAAAKIIYPDRFYREFDKEHEKIFDLLDNSDNPRKVIAAPRGTGKTSLSNLLIPTKKVAFLDSRFVVPVSNTSAAAEQLSENLKQEFMSNPVLKTIFNIQKTRNFSKKQWIVEIAGQRSMVWPKGAGQQVRGMLFQNSRPDLVIVDDLENDENLHSEIQRARLKEWFFGPLLNIIDRGRADWEIIYIDTLKHEDSLLQDLLEDSAWDSVVLEICDDNYETKFPNMIPTEGYKDSKTGAYVEGVKDIAEQYKEQGQLDVFFREYRNMPISTEDSSFKQDYFQYYTKKEKQPEFNDQRRFETVIIIDPAKTVKMNSAESALVGGSIDLIDGDFYYRDIVSGKFHPDELYNEMVQMIHRLKPSVVGVEVTGLNEFVTYPIKNQLIKHAPMVQLIELHARGGTLEPGKVARIRSLVPYFRTGSVWLNHANSGGLEAQLLSFPRSKRWDIMDAAAYFVEIFERGQKYAASAQDELPSREEVEQEWKELGYTKDEIRNPLVMRGI